MISSLNALCISDLQIPFSHKDALEFVQHVKKIFFDGMNPFIVNMGDETDQYTLSKYITSPNAMGAKAEFEEAKLQLKPWFAAFPKTYVCISNHTYRVYKKADEAGIPEGFIKTIGEAYEAPLTWQWRQQWIHDGVIFEHGENVSGPMGALNAAHQNRMSTVIGHLHSFGGVIHSATFNDIIFGMNTGCLIDVEQYAFAYAKTLRKKPTLGCGIIRDGIPYFIPMLCDHSGNWLRRI